jgi:hypothetical protein
VPRVRLWKNKREKRPWIERVADIADVQLLIAGVEKMLPASACETSYETLEHLPARVAPMIGEAGGDGPMGNLPDSTSST